MSLSNQAPSGSRPPRRRWRLSIASLIIAVIALAGLCVWMYPNAAAWFHQKDQSRIVENSVLQTGGDRQKDKEQLRLARKYNAALKSGAVYEANKNIAKGDGHASNGAPDYDKVLNDGTTDVMARLQIPKIKLDLPVYHGTSDATLLKGLGHLEGTSLPVGGSGTHAVITGHRGLAEATMFTHLDKVGAGDTFTITTFGDVLSYKVIRTQVVDPDQTRSLAAVEGKDLVTLVTCTPLGINSQRIFVTGQRIYPTPAKDMAAAHRKPDIPGFPWWAVVVGGGFVVAVTYVWWAGRPPKPRGATSVPDDAGSDPRV
jgi:sortase A